MPRIRTIKPEFWSNAKVLECSRDARLFFIGMWNYADDSGRLPFGERSLKAQIFPGDSDVDSQFIRRLLLELSENGLVKVYEVGGKEYIMITGWEHQRIDKPRPTQIPDPPFSDHSSNDRLPDRKNSSYLTLSNLTQPNLKGDAGSLASREALASQPEKITEAPKSSSPQVGEKGKSGGASPSLAATMRAKGWSQ